MAATGWQAHTVRAALSGLRKAGMTLAREKVDGETVYRIVRGGNSAATDPKASNDHVGKSAAIEGSQVGGQPDAHTGPEAPTRVETEVRS